MFNAEKFIKESIENLKSEIDSKALIAFSGGVDSTVCAALVNNTIGKLVCQILFNIFINQPSNTKSLIILDSCHNIHILYLDHG